MGHSIRSCDEGQGGRHDRVTSSDTDPIEAKMEGSPFRSKRYRVWYADSSSESNSNS